MRVFALRHCIALWVLLPGLLSCARQSHLVPPWAHVSRRQIEEAQRRGVPVAFENGAGIKFVLVPSGSFFMGSPDDELDRQEDEALHAVTVHAPFYMSMFEVTNDQFRRMRPAHASGHSPDDADDSLDGPCQPVVLVSFNDASEYASWLSTQGDGRAYRLPTEPEWEWAARGGTAEQVPYFWGRSVSDATRYANFYDAEKIRDGFQWTAPVGSFQPNGFGLFDILGNVNEWCDSVYGQYQTSGAGEGVIPDSDTRVVRGGSWQSPLQFVRLAFRDHGTTDDANASVGFRLVATLTRRTDRATSDDGDRVLPAD